MIKLCVNCRYYVDKSGLRPRCGKTAKRDPSLVTGDAITQYRSCVWERYDNWLIARLEGTCGKEGRFYAPKDEL